MTRWIEAVKNNVKQLRDRLEADYKTCDIRFAFVRYTDYDQPASTRNTWIDFTKWETHYCSYIISCKLHSVKIDKQRTSSTNQWKANTVYNIVMQTHPIPGSKNTLFLLPRSQSAFHGFVSKITTEAGCGGDTPEDIMGALKVVFTSLSWRSEGSKVYQ